MSVPTDAGSAEEERARAHCYALIGRLLYGPPDEKLAAYVLEHGPGDAAAQPLGRAWQALQTACEALDPVAARLEYDGLFVGVGKAPVTPYTAAYVAPQSPDRHLLALRNQLAAWGLARHQQAGETEDHVSGVCDVMRWLIDTGESLEKQRSFFFAYWAPAVEPLCNAISRAEQAAFYRTVAAFMQAFYEVERTSFELVDTP